MSLVLLVDAIKSTAPWQGAADELAKLLAQKLGADYLQRTPHNVCRLLLSKPMQKLLIMRGIELTVDSNKRIWIRRNYV